MLRRQTGRLRLALGPVERVAQAILSMHWNLEVARKPRLITSDAPLVLWRPQSYRDQFEGFGLRTAEEVRFPINPAMQLVLTHQRRDPVRRIEPDRVRTRNADMALACYQVIVGHPRRERQLKLIDLPVRGPFFGLTRGRATGCYRTAAKRTWATSYSFGCHGADLASRQILDLVRRQMGETSKPAETASALP
jgi:hypothetical protein